MPNRSTRLEVTWIGKENRPKREPRILFDSRRIFGDAAVKHSLWLSLMGNRCGLVLCGR